MCPKIVIHMKTVHLQIKQVSVYSKGLLQSCSIFSDLKAIKVESILKGSLEKLSYIWELINISN